jgi:hypothetical protein
MATISGTIRDCSCLYKEEHAGHGTRELWLVTADFGIYEDSADDAALAAVGAAIDATARDGKTSTLRGAVPVQAGDNGAGTGAYFTGATVPALTVSSDALTGELNNASMTELDAAAGCKGLGIAVIVDRA